jgi:Na+-driven multidrug efflux pump
MGTQSAGCTCVGFQIGRQDVKRALDYYRITLYCVNAIVIFSCILFYFSFGTLIKIFTTNEKVLQECMKTLLTALLALFFDEWQTYLQGIIKALGIQGEAVKIAAFSFIIMYPCLGVIFAFNFRLGFPGLFLAWAFSVFFNAAFLCYIIKNANWYKAAKDSASRLNI